MDADGQFVYSIGTDNVLKKAVTETGKVVKKLTLKDHKAKITKMVKATAHPFLLLGDEDGNVMMLNSETLELKNTIKKIHNGDAINDIFHFDKRSIYKFISLGQTTLAYWDARESNASDFQIAPDDDETKRKVLLSDDQEDEILCGTFVDSQVGDTIVCGMGEGILTVWKPEKNDLEDQLSRIKISKGESVDCIVPTLQDDNCVWCGCSNGNIYKVDAKRGKIVEIRNHSKYDEVTFLDLDCDYRVISGGMDKLKIWEFVAADEEEDDGFDDSEDESGSNNSDSDSESEDFSGFSDKDDEEKEGTDDNETSESDEDVEEELTGLSREELIAELDKDLVESSAEDEPLPKKRKVSAKPAPKKNDKSKKKMAKKSQNFSHSITKFEGL